MPEYYFHTQQLSVGYENTAILENVTIEVNRGEILTLIGPNGAGKSTLLRSIARQIKTLGGNAYLEEENLFSVRGSELAKKMAVVFTDRMDAEMMSCEDVVASGRYPYTGRFGFLSEDDRKIVAQSIKITHVTEFKDRDFRKVSDGQRQRVLLARALCQQPEIILLDEPTSYLDIRYQLEFLTILQQLAKEQHLSVIMSLHELELAKLISDRVLCIGCHGIERYGTPEEIFTPGYIASLFGMDEGCLADSRLYQCVRNLEN
jgi:iron complex transport system ATP-binding protein